MSWLSAWFGYGVGKRAAQALLGETKPPPARPIHPQTEAEIQADEARYNEEAKRLAAEDAHRSA